MRVLCLAGVSCESPFETMGATTITTRRAASVAPSIANARDAFLDSFDIVCFSGGTDISPSLYGQQPIGETQHPDAQRDVAEFKIFNYCQKNGIPVVGICRGLQLITALTGGQLIQHAENHGGVNHPVKFTESIGKYKKGDVIRVNSCHHQMCLPAENGVLLAVSHQHHSKYYFNDKGQMAAPYEAEAIIWPSLKAGGVQWHPEWMQESAEGHQVFLEIVREVMK